MSVDNIEKTGVINLWESALPWQEALPWFFPTYETINNIEQS